MHSEALRMCFEAAATPGWSLNTAGYQKHSANKDNGILSGSSSTSGAILTLSQCPLYFQEATPMSPVCPNVQEATPFELNSLLRLAGTP